MAAVLQAMWQADGAFPSGSFAFSYGIEGLLAWRGNVDAASLSELIGDLLRQRWPTYDRVALLRSFRAGGDIGAIADVDHDVEASTFGASLREGSRRNGSAFLASACAARRHRSLRGCVRRCVRVNASDTSSVMQGVVWRAMGLDEATGAAYVGILRRLRRRSRRPCGSARSARWKAKRCWRRRCP